MSTIRITDNDYADVALYDKVNAIADEIDSELSEKANSSNVVTTDTAQIINAVKTFTSDIKRIIDVDVTTPPASNKYFTAFDVINDDSSSKAYHQITYRTNGVLQNTYGLRRSFNGTNIFNTFTEEIDSSGESTFTLSVGNLSLVKNLVGKTDGSLRWDGHNLAIFHAYSVGARGYIKFTNGIIVQWGNESKGNNLAVTFPTPFSSTNYSVTMNNTTMSTDSYARSVNNKTTTGFTMHVGGGASNYTFNWIAVGY